MAATPSERIEYWRSPEYPGFEVLLGDHSTRRFRHFHESYTVSTLLDISGAEIEWIYRAKVHSAKAGGLALMEPGEIHANTRTHLPCRFRALFIAPSLVERGATELGMRCARPHLKFAHVTDPGLFQAFARLHAALEGTSSRLERETSLATCIRLLLERCTESGAPALRQPARSALLRARELIRDHFSRSIALDELAGATGLTRFHLVRAFAKEFGVPPHAYQINVQLAKARALLAAGCSPARAAAEAGFADQSHFSRHFKRIYGVTPGEYVRGGNARRVGAMNQ